MHKIAIAASLAAAASLTGHRAQAQVSVGGSASGSVNVQPPAPAGSALAATPAAAPAPASPAAPAPAAASLEVPPAEPALAPDAAAQAPAPAPVDEEDPAVVWERRDRDVGDSSALTGGVGLLHMQHAQGNAPGQFNVSFNTEYYSGNFLCTTSFPCPNPNGGNALTSDSMNHIGGSVQLSATVLKWLELYGGTSAYANSDTANKPALLQVLGDTDIGFKAFGKVGRVFHVGGAAELWLVNGTGAVGLDGGGTSAKFRGLATADLRESEKHTPIRFSINATYSLDNTGDVVVSTEQARGAPITRIERYGLGIDRVDHFDVGVGAEAFFVEQRIRPFVEYNISIPVNRQGYQCPVANPSGDNCLQNDALAPSKLSIGSRFLPWKHGFSILAAFDIGITGQNDFIEEMSPIPPWTLYLGIGWGIDTWDRPPVVETKIVEKEVSAPVGHIKGYVSETGKPEAGVVDAIVSFANHPEITSLATSADGHFTTLGLPAGDYAFAVKAAGYRDGTCGATLALVDPNAPPPAGAPQAAQAPAPAPAAGNGHPTIPDVNVTCTLEPLPRVGKIVGHVRDAESRAPVPNASIHVTDSVGHSFSQTADANGAFHFDGMAPAGYQLTASADEYMNDVESVEVKPRQDTPSEIVLMHRPHNPLVSVTAKEIVIKQQVQFATDSAVILPASNALLTEVADALVRSPRIKVVEIQGHTDSDGDDAHNQMLSEDRANAVRTWLVAHGVAGDRLIAKGYGEKKPLVPNVTPGNRARNRRVQFIIMDQDAPAPASPTPSPTGPRK